MRPTECEKCQRYFSTTLEAQTIHVLRTQGESAAQAFADEKLMPYHESHDEDDFDPNYQQEMR